MENMNDYAKKAVNDVAPGTKDLGNMLKDAAKTMIKAAKGPDLPMPDHELCPICPDPYNPYYWDPNYAYARPMHHPHPHLPHHGHHA